MDELKELFHASPNINIDILEPKAESVRDPNEGPVVFATDDKAYSTCFLVSTDDSWAKISSYQFEKNGLRIWVVCVSDEARFKAGDGNCAIYHLPSDPFYLDKNKHLKEWVSKIPVIPKSKEIFNSGIDAMIENNVQLYFVSTDQLEKLKSNPSDVKSAVQLLQSVVSENEKRGKENLIKKYFHYE